MSHNSRRWRLILWSGLGLFWLSAGVGAIWLSHFILQLDRGERQARLAAAIEENLRLSLWRIDSLLTPWIANMAWLPESTLATQSASGLFLNPSIVTEQLAVQVSDPFPIIGPVACTDLPSIDAQGSKSSQDATGEVMPHLRLSASQVDEIKEKLRMNSQWLMARTFSTVDGPQNSNRSMQVLDPPGQEPALIQQSLSRSSNEFNQRLQNFAISNSGVNRNRMTNSLDSVSGQQFSLVWHDGNLLMAREVARENQVLEAYLVDWEQLQLLLKKIISDLLPEAHFEPVIDSHARSSPDMLASLPVRLLPGLLIGTQEGIGESAVVESLPSSLPASSVIAAIWLAFFTSLLASGLLIEGLIRLSERRANFVAAVTHELRTPLTTLRLYTEMLHEGYVSDEATKRSYLSTLMHQVDRIGHLVENVFAYARLEQSGRSLPLESMRLSDALDQVKPRLDELCARASMKCIVEVSPSWSSQVQLNLTVFEQILINLVDNVTKYARHSVPNHVVLQSQAVGEDVHVCVRDFGPGFPKGYRWKLPFSKSVQRAAETAPGIGLGLAISQSLAKRLGGRLITENMEIGGRATLILRATT